MYWKALEGPCSALGKGPGKPKHVHGNLFEAWAGREVPLASFGRPLEGPWTKFWKTLGCLWKPLGSQGEVVRGTSVGSLGTTLEAPWARFWKALEGLREPLGCLGLWNALEGTWACWKDLGPEGPGRPVDTFGKSRGVLERLWENLGRPLGMVLESPRGPMEAFGSSGEVLERLLETLSLL